MNDIPEDSPVELVELRVEEPDSAAALACLQAYFAELAERFPAGFDPDASVSAEPDECRPPYGVFLVGWAGGRAVGCGVVKTMAPGIAEIKRMWIDRSHRGTGLGGRLLARLEAEAAALGLPVVRLDTSAHLTEAVALYRRRGYEEIAAYNENPYAHHWFEKRI